MINQFNDFEKFITWLKNDGIIPIKSERLWRKKIFQGLSNGDKKTLVNYDDFLHDEKINSLINSEVRYLKIDSKIVNIKKTIQFYILHMENASILKIRVNDLDNFIKNFVKEQIYV